MISKKFARTSPHLNMHVVAHLDHGKTSLTAAITKVLAESGTGASTMEPARGSQGPAWRQHDTPKGKKAGFKGPSRK